VHGVVFTGRRYDTGDRLEYLKTVVRLAAERADLGPDFRSWLLDFVDKEHVGSRQASTMKSVDQHLSDLLSGIEAISPLDLQLLDAHGCILSEAVVADVDLPPFDNSSMDGYAVRVADVADASESNPVKLPVVGDIAAGSSSVLQRAAGPLDPDHDRRAHPGRRRRRSSDRVDRPGPGLGEHHPRARSRAVHPPRRRGRAFRRAGPRHRHPASGPARSGCSPPSAGTG
jgi:molybdopterin molybdotransferase